MEERRGAFSRDERARLRPPLFDALPFMLDDEEDVESPPVAESYETQSPLAASRVVVEDAGPGAPSARRLRAQWAGDWAPDDADAGTPWDRVARPPHFEPAKDHPLTEEELSQKQAELNRAAHASPTDLSAWLALISFQDQIPYLRKHPTAKAEKKLSIMERALSHLPDEPSLWDSYLDLTSTVRDRAKVEVIWERSINHPQLSFTTSHSLHLWMIRYTLSSPSSFNVMRTEDAYASLVENLLVRPMVEREEMISLSTLSQLCAFYR